MDSDVHTTKGKLADFQRRNEQAKQPASEAAIAKLHEKGKLTARERIDMLLDPGSFEEMDMFKAIFEKIYENAEKRLKQFK